MSKLYYFNPNDWGLEYFVMSDSKEEALESVIDFLKEKAVEEQESYKEMYKLNPELNDGTGYYQDLYNEWKLVKDVSKLLDNYTIKEYGKNEVIDSELS
jgi:hypothetical protein